MTSQVREEVTMSELGKRAIAAMGGKWPLGMRVICIYIDDRPDIDRGTVIGNVRGMPLVHWDERASNTGPLRYDDVRAHHPTEHLLPDMDAPSIVGGGLLHLVREAWGDPHMHMVARHHEHPHDSSMPGQWLWEWDRFVDGAYDTEADALISAIEAAPSPTTGAP